jgi:NAD(P)-dependent dehydrogenase (short-subunit alcohol dehydrogenase family)
MGAMKKVLVVGASGLLGRSIVDELGDSAEVVTASRSSCAETVDISSRESIERLFARVGQVDGLVCVAGTAPFLPWADATDDHWAHGLANKLMGQVNLARIGSGFVRDGGAIVLTTGVLSDYPIPGSAIVTTVNAAIDGFVRSAAIEIGRGVRVNAVSPGWVTETMEAMGMDSSPGMPAAEVARIFIDLLEGDVTGQTVRAVKGV